MREKLSNSFTTADYENAALAFSLWQGTQHETVDEYLLRKRKIELNCLVKKVISNELSDLDREIVRLHWYNGNSITDTAKVLGIDRSKVSRRLDKINDTIYDKLKYAMEYRYGRDYSASVKMIIKNKDALCLVSEDLSSPCKRIRNLRVTQGFTLEDAQTMTGIDVKKLDEMEKGKRDISVRDVVRIATAFKASGDYIIFGSDKGGTAHGFIN
ncbi:MAG: helix-turn-helix domain-containing protein [Clostridia bacterium]|nr:helix-turn-helix domain-containing protein [Clostridia bacterium]